MYLVYFNLKLIIIYILKIFFKKLCFVDGFIFVIELYCGFFIKFKYYFGLINVKFWKEFSL